MDKSQSFNVKGKYAYEDSTAELDFTGRVEFNQEKGHAQTIIVQINYSGRANNPLYQQLGRNSHIFDGKTVEGVVNQIKLYAQVYKLKFSLI